MITTLKKIIPSHKTITGKTQRIKKKQTLSLDLFLTRPNGGLRIHHDFSFIYSKLFCQFVTSQKVRVNRILQLITGLPGLIEKLRKFEKIFLILQEAIK